MHFDSDFFEGEYRCDFYIPPLMKRCWAANLEVLKQFDLICKKHGLRYFLAYGTLLGAVRHHGFIPWDDDIDVWMFRKDVVKLIECAQTDIEQAGLTLVTPFSKNINGELTYRLINTSGFRIDKGFLSKYHGFPYMAGLDLFTLNYVTRDDEALNLQKVLIESANSLALQWNDEAVDHNEKMETYDMLMEILGGEHNPEISYESELWRISDRIMAMYDEEQSDCVAVISNMFRFGNQRFKKEWFEEQEMCRFETDEFLICKEYDKVIREIYGDGYMNPQKLPSAHDYPYFKGRMEMLVKFFNDRNMEIPESFLM